MLTDDRQQEENVEPAEKTVALGLPSDQALQRYLLKRVHYGREFRVTYKSGRIREGFVTAFDEFHLQLSTSKNPANPKAVLISMSSIEDIEETDKGLFEFDEEFQDKIREYSKSLRIQCVREINSQRRKASPKKRYNGEVPQ